MADDFDLADADADERTALLSGLVLFPLVTSGLSIVMSSGFICAYATNRKLRRHPAALVLWRSVFDLMFSVQLACQLMTQKSALECKAGAVVMQFSILASECCFLGISADLLLALTQPFHDYKASRRSIIAAILLSNLAIAGTLAWLQHRGERFCHGANGGAECLPVWLSFSAPHSARRSDIDDADHRLAICWLYDAHHGTTAWLGTQLFFFVPVLAIYAYALSVYARAAGGLRTGGLKSSVETRRVVLERSRRLLVGGNSFVLAWGVPYVAMLLLSFHAGRSLAWAHAYYLCAHVFLVVLGFRGAATVGG
jgi:hypothetical protein